MKLLIDDKVGQAYALNANEACVYAAIARYSRGKGWYANCDTLAKHLPFVISAKTVERAVRHLTELGIVEKRQNVLFARTNCPSPETNCPNPETNCLKSETNCPSPTPPIIKEKNKEIKKEMKDNDRTACATLRTADPKNRFSFLAMVDLYKQRIGDCQMAPAILDDARSIWSSDAYPEWKRALLFIELKNPNGWVRPRLDWTLTGFNPQPTNYNGSSEFERMVQTGTLVTALFNGQVGIYTRQDARRFGMTVKKHLRPNPDIPVPDDDDDRSDYERDPLNSTYYEDARYL